jgi:hypothetical protein
MRTCGLCSSSGQVCTCSVWWPCHDPHRVLGLSAVVLTMSGSLLQISPTCCGRTGRISY